MVVEFAPHLQQPTDGESISRSVGEPRAFVVVFNRHFGLVHRFISVRAGNEMADDLAAETFATAYRKRQEYNDSYPDARAWLLGIAINLIRDAQRSERRRRAAYERLSRERYADTTADVLTRLDAHSSSTQLSRLLRNLEPVERDLLLLHACVELSYQEIAEILRIPVGTVRSRLHRLRGKLRPLLAGTPRSDEGAKP